MGLRTVAIGGGPDKEHLAQKLGAHIYIDAKAEDAAAALQKLGGADVILATAPSGAAIGSLLPGLKTRGKLVVVGVSADAIPVNAYRSSSADGQLSAVSPEERLRLKTRLISAYSQMFVQ